MIESLERAAGIEPTSSAWKAGTSPLGQAREYSEHRQQGKSLCRSHSPSHTGLPGCVRYPSRVYLVRGVACCIVNSPTTPQIGCGFSRCANNFLASVICRARQTCVRVPPLGSWQHKYLVEAKGFEPLRCEDLGYSQAPSTTRPHLQNWLRTDAWHPLTLVNSQPPAPACLYGKSKTPQNGASGKSRTPYLLDRSQALCPDELRTRKTGAPCPHRTDDRSLTRRLLCQLS